MGHASENAERPILNVEGNLVALGPLRRDLLALYQRWINDLGTMRTLGLAPLPMTREKKQDWYDRQSKAESDVPFTIYERETLRPPDRAVLRRWPTSSRGLCGNRPARMPRLWICSRRSHPWTVCSPTCPPGPSARLTSCASTLGLMPPWPVRWKWKRSRTWSAPWAAGWSGGGRGWGCARPSVGR